mmetsp:Transcript_55039/g.153454  ORF Transcript_55039/g.153454 Transcript_55039/m.153454 type:complete len:303 (-) Transcript_55039:11-919(-)
MPWEADQILNALLEDQIESVRNKSELTKAQCESLCEKAREVLQEESNCQPVRCPVTVCGDIHGQFLDLKELFCIGGCPPETNYLFLGDYVDRGYYSVKTVSLMFLYKTRYKERFTLLRGNHESRQITQVYGFFDECKRRFANGCKLWKTFGDVFNVMPVCAVVNDRIICMHGGLSPELTDLDQIRQLPRPISVPDSGVLCDLLWADPSQEVATWGDNDRGVSFTFGAEVVKNFLKKHDLDLIARAHQVVEDGYEFFANRGLVTVFSAPNYCREFDNAAALMSIDEDLLCSFKVLKALPPGKP